jgi:PEP-CTERM motif
LFFRSTPRNGPPKAGNELSSQGEAGSVQPVVRRRRSRRHRRNRIIRRALLLVACGAFSFTFALLALRHLTPSLFRASRPSAADRREAEASRDRFLQLQEQVLSQMEARPVYPYSVVPGGIRDVHELRLAAERDPVVASHYRGFDYDHARVVRLVLAQTVYVSYRIGNKVYWTRHRVSLKKGETVITDGRMTARTRCGNRVEEVPQQATSSAEPPAEKFEEPIHPAVGTALRNPPVPFESALMQRPGVPGLGPAPPLSLYDPFGQGAWTPVFLPSIPGVCPPTQEKNPKKGEVASVAAEVKGNKKKNGDGNPCGGPAGGGGEVPEPGTWLLVASGLILMYWISRHRLARV